MYPKPGDEEKFMKMIERERKQTLIIMALYLIIGLLTIIVFALYGHFAVFS